MLEEDLVEYCLAKPGAKEDFPFGPMPMVIKVGGKIFAFFMMEAEMSKLSLKCDPVIAANLREENASIIPGYHLNKKHWNTILLDGSISVRELEAMIDHSYELVAASLPARIRPLLSGASPSPKKG
jgi:predicted DNA-binding protein (MmcQ/YjbR family)